MAAEQPTPSTSRNAASTVVLIALAAALLGAAAAAGLIWIYRQQTITELRRQAEEQAELVSSLEAQIASLTAPPRPSSTSSTPSAIASATPAASSTPTAGTSSPSASGGSASQTTQQPAAPTSRKEFTYLTKVNRSGNDVTIVADFAQLLTGEAAAKAAADRGDESPPPNDYYILNESKQLRTLPVNPDATVRLTTTSEGTTAGPEGYSVPLLQFVTLFSSTLQLQQAPYYITVRNGTVTAIAQVYLP